MHFKFDSRLLNSKTVVVDWGILISVTNFVIPFHLQLDCDSRIWNFHEKVIHFGDEYQTTFQTFKLQNT
jgi:hypothetical protein